METKINELTVNSSVYVLKDSIAVNTMAVDTNGLEYCIIRGDRSGVFAGYLKSREGKEVELLSCRRIWYWDGASSISQLALDGVSKPQNCKFPAPIKMIVILDAIEIIPATEKARKSIEEVSIWKS